MRQKSNMKKYCRYIGKVQISIFIEESLYKKYHTIFKSLFRTYISANEESHGYYEEYIYYILSSNYDQLDKNHRLTVCDTQNDSWIFTLISDLDEFYAEVLRCTVLHGSCLQINGKNILLIGERWSGKTTLTRYLTINKNGFFLNDDSIYLIDNTIIGFGMPLPIRNAKINDYEDYFVAQTTDSDDVVRFLYSPPNIINDCNTIDAIIFPKYILSGRTYIKKTTKGDTFNTLIKKVRFYGTMGAMFDDIKKLSQLSDCYSIEYSSCSIVYDLLIRGFKSV